MHLVILTLAFDIVMLSPLSIIIIAPSFIIVYEGVVVQYSSE